ncbi:LOW QUALITY PROTEIN: ly6/PLAUR domain-containing protein 8 [Otolemur garnettii]|uniref:LOW QUALITY PROTEIN: ly6/PLAUR domain-containing protein 8 n=1 Tax=Otolemur garnettii TaxID=30611 RepID=UPI000C7F5401|nr:LOW QUALITY PROTEIN: ly6/PLAUR domain-containing protein 8 [Otolemur garnettii]
MSTFLAPGAGFLEGRLEVLWPYPGESVNVSAMKGVLIAGIILALAVAAVESLSCVQCHSWENSCVNVTATECPSDANTSCVGSSASSSLAPPRNISSNIECPACYGSDGASCTERLQKCQEEERCVSLVADFENDTASDRLVLRGCSHISGSTCQFLSVGNKTVGGVVFREFQTPQDSLF